MNRRVLAGLALLCVLALAGCLGPSEVPEEELTAEGSYDWETNATTTFNISRSSYTTVVEVTNQTELPVWRRDELGSDSPVQLEGLRFRFENGTVVNASRANMSVTQTNDRSMIALPAENGTVAYTASRSGKGFSSPAFLEGSYEVVLPPSARIGIPLLSQASPGGYSTSLEDDRMTVRWDEISGGAVNVRYYLERDLLLFTGLAVFVVAVGIGGALYYIREIRTLEKRRKEMGDEVEYDDDPRDRGPPPGMG
jgi:hypothetical protein